MMDIDAIGIGVETRQVKQASKDLDKLGVSADKASRKADGLSKANKEVESTSSVAARTVGKLAAAYAALQSFRALGGMVDTYTKFNAQLKIAARTQEDFTNSYQDVVRISNLAQSGIEGTATLYARLANTLKDTNVTQQQFADITESVALGLRVSGASAGEAQSAMLQLSQAFASGVLRGEEFNAVSEASFPLMKALADSMGIPIEQLRSMAMEGMITRDELVKAFADPKLIATFREQAKEVQTMGGAVTTAKNEFLLFVGTVAKKTGIVDIFTVAINGGSQALRSFNSLLTTGKFKLDAFLPAYDKYRQKMDEEAKKAGLAPKKFGFAGRIGDAISADEVAGIPSLGGILTASDPKKKADEIIKASGNASKAISSDAKRLAQEQQEFELKMYNIEVQMAEDAREWKDNLEKEAEKERFEALDRWMKYQQKRADENFKIAQDQAKKIADEYEKQADRIADSLTDALYRGFESGKSFAENFIDTLKNTFKTLVLQPIIRFLVDSSGITKVLGALGGTFASGSAQASAGGANSIMSSLGGIKDVISSLNGSLVGSIEKLGVFLSTGNGGLGDMIGGALGQYAGTIADVLPYAGAALQLLSGDVKGAALTGIGTAIGTAIGGPIGGAIGGALGGVLGGFGSKERAKIFSSTATRQYANGEFVSGNNNPYESGKRFEDLGANKSVNAISDAFAKTLGTIFNEFGVTSNMTTRAVLGQRKDTARGVFYAGFGGGNNYTYDQGGDGTAQQQFARMLEAVLSQGVLKGIRSSTLPQSIKDLFDGLTTKEQVLDAINSIIAMRKALVDLPPVFDAVRLVVDGVANFATGIEQLKATYTNTQNFVNLFYSDAEKLEITFKQLTTQFGAMNQVLPDSREGFRALVDNFNVFDEATFNTYSTLVALAPALDAYYQALEQQRDALESLASTDYFSNIIDFQRYQATANNFGRASANTLLSDSPAVMGVLAEVRDAILELRTVSQQTAKSSQKTADLLTNVTLDGEALQTQAAA